MTTANSARGHAAYRRLIARVMRSEMFEQLSDLAKGRFLVAFMHVRLAADLPPDAKAFLEEFERVETANATEEVRQAAERLRRGPSTS